eukprot:TRINITY_DN1399_c0_g1_i9.p1 TRINITY_DN1399_c0_g1~~TRINITY_DN1399_c0_g1_i9.p1  ORF type:complete len:602 (-),score=212.83 TRINITY_DN1399_c0_g1_i9:475-2280(-)
MCIRDRYNKYGYEMRNNDDHRNNLLHKAITFKLAHDKTAKCVRRAQVQLTELKANRAKSRYYDSDDEDANSGSVASQLKKMDLSTVPPEDDWVQITPYLEFKESTDDKAKKKSSEKDDKSRTIIKRHEFRSSAPNARELVAEYVDGAYRWYVERLKSQEDDGRYMYNPIPKSEGHWKRYKLSDQKSFDCLFFPQKQRLLSFVQHFENKSGKFSIDGYPHKMGLLLHGPPGTGKTSLIKALAQHMERNIVNIPLSRIKTNQQLMDYVFDQSFNVPGMDSPCQLDYSKTIFVFEDVDAAGKIVHRRDEADPSEDDPMLLKDSLKRTPTNDVTAPALTRTGSRIAEVGETPLERQQTPKQGTEDADVTAPTLSRTGSTIGKVAEGDAEEGGESEGTGAEGEDNTKKGDDKGEGDAEKGEGADKKEDDGKEEGDGKKEEGDDSDQDDDEGRDKKKGKGGSATGASQSDNDKLDLAGVLNVLDGVVDCPNRVVIMTTNHPEKLDPALIRPGRINLKIYLGYLEMEEALLMAEHYFGGYAGRQLTHEQEGEFRTAWGKLTREDGAKLNLTPAQLEQFCAENDTMDDLNQTLAKLVQVANAKEEAAAK